MQSKKVIPSFDFYKTLEPSLHFSFSHLEESYNSYLRRVANRMQKPRFGRIRKREWDGVRQKYDLRRQPAHAIDGGRLCH